LKYQIEAEANYYRRKVRAKVSESDENIENM
jgi:hypothetical protein